MIDYNYVTVEFLLISKIISIGMIITIIIFILLKIGLISFLFPKKNEFEKACSVIKDFELTRNHSREETYAAELFRELKSNGFPNAKLEYNTSFSRPDIVLDNIAIEVKGPTYNKDLDTIAGKIFKYGKNYKSVIVVLFNCQFNRDYYEEALGGFEYYFNYVNLMIITKDKNSEDRILNSNKMES